MFKIVLAAIAVIVSASPIQAQNNAQKGNVVSVTPEIVKELAPTGKLRVGINFGNIVLAQGTPDAPQGITPELARELGKRLGTSIEFVSFDAAGRHSRR